MSLIIYVSMSVGANAAGGTRYQGDSANGDDPAAVGFVSCQHLSQIRRCRTLAHGSSGKGLHLSRNKAQDLIPLAMQECQLFS